MSVTSTELNLYERAPTSREKIQEYGISALDSQVKSFAPTKRSSESKNEVSLTPEQGSPSVHTKKSRAKECQECGLLLSNSSNLKRHLKTHIKMEHEPQPPTQRASKDHLLLQDLLLLLKLSVGACSPPD